MLLFLIICALLVYAGTSPILRPVADGVSDSASWTSSNGKKCNKTDCSAAVKEARGSFCDGSDGDASYIESRTKNARQTFKLNLSTIPATSTITKVAVTVCAKKRGAKDAVNAFRTSLCVNGTCANGGADLMATTTYASFTQVFNVSVAKTATTTIEIGAAITGTKNTFIRISKFAALATFGATTPVIPPSGTTSPPTGTTTPPMGTSTPPTGTTTPPVATTMSAPVRVSFGGAVIPTQALFSGQAYPGGIIEATWASPVAEQYGIVPEERTDIAPDGSFRLLLKNLLQAPYTFILRAFDSDGRPSGPVVFTADFESQGLFMRDGLVFPPREAD